MLLSLFNNLNKSDKEVRNGIWEREGNRGVELAGKTIGINSRKSTKASVTVSIDEKENWIQLPNILLPPVKKKKPGNKYDLYNLEITDKEISGKFKINIINKPSMTIDRYTGVMTKKGFGSTFDGQCEKVDLTEKKF